jgi:hypothetical protein
MFAWELGCFFASASGFTVSARRERARAGLSGYTFRSVKLSAKCQNPDRVAMHKGFISYSIRIIRQMVEGASVIRLLKGHFR